ALLVFFIASALLRLASLDFGRRRCLFGHGILSRNRGHGKKSSMRCGRGATWRRRRRRIQIAERRQRHAQVPCRSGTTRAFGSAALVTALAARAKGESWAR